MSVLVAFSVAPSTDDPTGSVSAAVAEAVRVVRASGLPCRTDAMFTTVEGETWDEVMAVVSRAVAVVAEHSPRTSVVIKADLRPTVARRADGQGRGGRAAPERTLSAPRR